LSHTSGTLDLWFIPISVLSGSHYGDARFVLQMCTEMVYIYGMNPVD